MRHASLQDAGQGPGTREERQTSPTKTLKTAIAKRTYQALRLLTGYWDKMEIEIQTTEELELLLDALGREIVFASIYHRLFWDLVNSLPGHEREFQQSNTFWSLTLHALREKSMIHLCRVYDQQETSLSLANLLDTIKANIPFFSENHFRERLAGNAFVDCLAKANRKIPIHELENDIKSVSCDNPTIKKLMIWRNNIIAHRGAKVSLGRDQVLRDNPLSKEELEHLLEQGLDIFNKYSLCYRASTQSPQIIGHDDYKYLLEFIGLGLQKWDEDIKGKSGH